MPPLRLLITALAAALAVAPSLSAQVSRSLIYSRPEIPSTEALRRLNLRLAWRGYVPTDGARDALLGVELIGPDLIAVTRAGTVQRMNAETGRVHWRTNVGKPFTLLGFIAVNNRSVYVVANAKMYAVDRATGALKWEYAIPSGVSAAPVADDEQIFIPTVTSHLYAFYLPVATSEEAAGPVTRDRRSALYGGGERDDAGPQPRPTWSDLTNIQLAFRPVQSSETVFVVSPGGRALGFSKVPREGTSGTEAYSLRTEGRIRVAPGSYGDTAYVGSDDAALYAVNMNSGRLRWRYTAGTAITRPPAATLKDVYVTSDREGLSRIDRETGDAVWRIPSGRTVVNANVLADRFLAANERFVYATDNSGRLLVLDHKRGVRLSMLDTRAYRVPVVNEVTDRLYLAANNGLIVCLHDRDLADPIRHRKALEIAESPLARTLAKEVDEELGKEMTLREALLDLRARYKLRYVVDFKAFKEAEIPDPLDRKVRPPRTEKKTFRDHLQRLLAQAEATFEVPDERLIRILPAPKPKEKDKDKEKEKEK